MPVPFETQTLPVTDGHVLQVRHYGRADGIPALGLHGGPGSGGSPLLARFFDPQRFHVILMDQRGAGGSRPAGDTAHNTTAHLLADLRALRRHLGLSRWFVVGGSWGATLALAHALDEPAAIAGLLMRGLFLARRADIAAFFDGPAHGSPPAWRALEAVAARRPGRLLDSLAEQLASPDIEVQAAVALAWSRWEQWLSDPTPPSNPPQGATHDAEPLAANAPHIQSLIQRYRVQSHYLRHGCWFDDAPLLPRCAAMPAVPMRLLHGTADRICPPAGAAALAAQVPGLDLQWIEGAGHDPTHSAMADAMVRATDAFADSAAGRALRSEASG